jgi:hypothetical protein
MKEWIDSTPGRTDPRRLMLGLGLLPLAGIAIFAVGMLGYRPRGPQLWMLVLAIVTLLITAVPAMLDRARPMARRHLLLSLIILTHSIFFVAPVFMNYLLEDHPTRPIDIGMGYLEPSSLVRALLAVDLGLLAMLAGYALPVGRGLARMLPQPRHEWSDRGTILAACIGIPVGWIVLLAGIFGVIPPAAGTAVFDPIIGMTVLGIGMLALVYIRSSSRVAWTLMLVIIPITMGFNFFTGSKGKFFAPIIMLGLTYVMVERRIRLSWLLAGFAAVVLVYPAAQFYRDVLTEGLTRGTAAMLRDPAGVLRAITDFASNYGVRDWLVDGVGATLNRFDGLSILALIMQATPDVVPYQGGWTIGLIFLFWIPRAIWPDKPVLSVGRWINDTYTLGAGLETSVGSTWIGEFYLNFGWLGVFFGMLGLGILYRVLHEALLAHKPIVPTLLAGVSIVQTTAIQLGGNLLAITGIFWSVVQISVLHALVRFFGLTVVRGPEAARSAPRAPAGEASGLAP